MEGRKSFEEYKGRKEGRNLKNERKGRIGGMEWNGKEVI
jgi:hypothetical protein